MAPPADRPRALPALSDPSALALAKIAELYPPSSSARAEPEPASTVRRKATDEDRLLGSIRERPGQSRRALRIALKVGANRLGALLDRLAEEGKIENRGDGWFPVSVTEDGEQL